MPEVAPPSLEEFDTLKRDFATAVSLDDFWNGFLDNFASRPGFMQLGAPAHVEEMEIIICRIASQMMNELVEPESTRLVKIPEAKMVHGSCLVKQQLSCILFFEDLEMGLFVMVMDSGKVNYARFALPGKHQA